MQKVPNSPASHRDSLAAQWLHCCLQPHCTACISACISHHDSAHIWRCQCCCACFCCCRRIRRRRRGRRRRAGAPVHIHTQELRLPGGRLRKTPGLCTAHFGHTMPGTVACNMIGTTPDTVSGGWIKQLRSASGRSNLPCSVDGCDCQHAAVGGHVALVLRGWAPATAIIPMCKKHNHYQRMEPQQLKPHTCALLVRGVDGADPTDACVARMMVQPSMMKYFQTITENLPWIKYVNQAGNVTLDGPIGGSRLYMSCVRWTPPPKPRCNPLSRAATWRASAL
jgi:hypothetical protein